jgi:hypothetical protein
MRIMKRQVSDIIVLNHQHDISIAGLEIRCHIQLIHHILVIGDDRSEEWRVIFQTPRGSVLLETADSEAQGVSMFEGLTQSRDYLTTKVNRLGDEEAYDGTE